MGVVNRDAAVQIGQSVVVFGVGGVGVNIVQSAQMVSAYPIVAVDIVDSKLEWAQTFRRDARVQRQRRRGRGRIREVVGATGRRRGGRHHRDARASSSWPTS